KVWDEQNLTNEETKQLEQARKLLDENDQNFSNYLKNNKLRSEYKKDTYRISEKFTVYNDTLNKLDNSIQQMEKKANDGEISIKEVKDIIPDSNKVNGKQQEKIEKFRKIRSEEHTSELQSRFDIVCRLLLEYKKYNIT